MLISNNKTIKEVKDEFNKKFPLLKLEFFSSAHEVGERNKSTETLDESLSIGEIRANYPSKGEESIDGHQKVSTLEQKFKERFGVNVQVFRKSGKIWLQTTTTDNWTLAEQQREAEEFELN